MGQHFVRDLEDQYWLDATQLGQHFIHDLEDQHWLDVAVLDLFDHSTQSMLDQHDHSTQSMLDLHDHSTQSMLDLHDHSNQSSRYALNLHPYLNHAGSRNQHFVEHRSCHH